MVHPNPKASKTVTRRALLSAVSAIAVVPLSQWPGRAFAQDLNVDAFLALSQDLTDQEDLSEDVAAGMLAAFSSTGHAENLAALTEGESDEALANAIVASWYSGVSPDEDALDVLTYTDALMWQAMEYTKPMAYCGGEVGYWADPPSA